MDWNLLLTIITLFATLLFGIITIIQQWRKKSFSYSVSETPVVSIHHKIEGVEVLFNKKHVENMRLILVKLWNSGNVPIKKQDFDSPITLCPAYNAKGNGLIDAQIVESPEGTKAELTQVEPKHHYVNIALSPMLFNPGDGVTIKIIIVDYGGDNPKVEIQGHIEGVKMITEASIYTKRSLLFKILLAAIGFSFVFLYLQFYSFVFKYMSDSFIKSDNYLFNLPLFIIVILCIGFLPIIIINLIQNYFLDANKSQMPSNT